MTRNSAKFSETAPIMPHTPDTALTPRPPLPAGHHPEWLQPLPRALGRQQLGLGLKPAMTGAVRGHVQDEADRNSGSKRSGESRTGDGEGRTDRASHNDRDRDGNTASDERHAESQHSPALPFAGHDLWTAYELSWLDRAGRPRIAVAELIFPASSPRLIESKSLKLYLNGLNQHRFASEEKLTEALRHDLSEAAGAAVKLRLRADAWAPPPRLAGTCLDHLELRGPDYLAEPQPALLGNRPGPSVRERLYTRLFRSLCPVTGQPDWATVELRYRGPSIDHPGLLGYLLSYREHAGFHEHCVERIYMDLLRHCRPEWLSVHGRFLRRGGLDINPYRCGPVAPPPSAPPDAAADDAADEQSRGPETEAGEAEAEAIRDPRQ